MHLVILSGRSGSGKTIALHALEDMGFYCIDNLPIGFLPNLEKQVGPLHPSIAVSIDARNIPAEHSDLEDIIAAIKNSATKLEIIYLDADENVLLNRFNETRRKHPLTNQHTSLREAIRKEQQLLTPMANSASLTIDTNSLANQDLCRFIKEAVDPNKTSHTLVLLQSFGFKYGVPSDSDFVFDVRCLPNPYWEPSLRQYSGLDSAVVEYLQDFTETQQLLGDISNFIEKWIPRFEANNRSYISIAIGCTGGKHRSVFIVESLAKRIQDSIPHAQVRHRDLEKIHYQSSHSQENIAL